MSPTSKTAAPQPPLVKAGDSYRNFKVLRSEPLDELRMHLLELEHGPTGAKVMHILSDDPENVFCLSFQTRPDSSNGVAHILEHTVLCGSKKYPLHDPFFSMLRRSLHTYMNALTGQDFTCYPAASQVEVDFYNILDVYLDAVFHPHLSSYSFKQEGHRLEYSEPTDSSSPLEYKGVVYSEMKGSHASAMSRIMKELNAALYPDITYGHFYAGEPREILKLTRDELVAFHREYYHPSRCLFFFYGNLPTTKHLDFIADRLLEGSARVAALPPIPRQRRYDKPRYSQCHYPATAEQKPSEHTMVAIGWLTAHILEQETLLALYLIDLLLMDNDASPLKRALLDSSLCKQATLYVDPDSAETSLTLLLKGCDSGNAAAIDDFVQKALRTIAAQGFDEEAIERALHQLEFQRTEIGGGGAPFGLQLFMRAALPQQHGADAAYSLKIHSLFAALRQRLHDNPSYLSDLIRHYLLDNPHRVVVSCLPDEGLISREEQEEAQQLEAIAQRLTPEQKNALVEEAQAFAAHQQSQEEQDREILPKITIDQVPKQCRDYPLTTLCQGDAELFHHDTFTNDIVYVNYVLPQPQLTQDELPYVALLASLLAAVGCGGRSFATTLEHQQAYVGGIGCSLQCYSHVDDPAMLVPAISIDAKALRRNVPQLLRLMGEMATTPDFHDLDRLEELLLKQWAGLQSSLTQRGMRYAINLAAGGLCPSGYLNYWWSGVGYYQMMRELCGDLKGQLPRLAELLTELHRRLFHNNEPHIVVSSDASSFESLVTHGFYGLCTLPRQRFTPRHEAIPTLTVPSQGRVIATQVAFTVQMMHSPHYQHPDAAALCAASQLMDNLTLHRRLREEGGAYGSGASCDTTNGLFYMYGYRDPNLSRTLDAFNEACDKIASGAFDDNFLYEAKLEMLQDMDAPVSPGARAALAYGWWRSGKTAALRQRFRDSLLALDGAALAQAVQRHLVPSLPDAIVVSFAGKSLLEQENKILTDKGLKTLLVQEV